MTPELVCELIIFHRKFFLNLFRHNFGPCAAMYREYGPLADHPHAAILKAAEARARYSPEAVAVTNQSIGADLLSRIDADDAEFFEQLTAILRARREGKILARLPVGSFGLKARRGRKLTPHDLSVAVPWAVHRLLLRRNPLLRQFTENPNCEDTLISREELQTEIACEQFEGGLTEPILISDQELSRWITKMGIAKFMGPPSVWTQAHMNAKRTKLAPTKHRVKKQRP